MSICCLAISAREEERLSGLRRGPGEPQPSLWPAVIGQRRCVYLGSPSSPALRFRA